MKNLCPECRRGTVTMTDKNMIRDRIQGCLVAGAAGDALGYAVEFDKLKVIRKNYGDAGITEYDTAKFYGEAVFSDDTQMTLFTADGLLNAEKAREQNGSLTDKRLYNYVHDAYIDWYVSQGCPAIRKNIKGAEESGLLDFPEMNKRRAPGITCINALSTSKPRDLYRPINNSKGCGGIMRVAPVGLMYPDASLETVVERAAEVSAITHGHPLGCFPSGIFAAIVQQAAFREEDTPLAVMIDKAVAAARNLYGKSDMWDDLEALIDKAVSFAGNDRDDDTNIKELGEGWVAEETLAVSVYCALKYEHDLSAGLIASVNHDGDSDSTGSVAGNILGALHGYEAIDDKWKNRLQLKFLILRMADRIADHVL